MADAAPSTPIAQGESSGPARSTWPDLPTDHPLEQLASKLPSLITSASHSEIYGIDMSTCPLFQRNLILQKFLRANSNDVVKAEAQLASTLEWRRTFEPLKARDDVYSRRRFGGLGYVTEAADVPGSPNASDVVTYNVYGAVTDNKETFGDIDAFMRWRIGVMELGIARLGLARAELPIPDWGEGSDPYQGIQVHDYLGVSFLRQDPYAKAAAGKAIQTFSAYYPETLSRKLFVNVPVIMGWMFSSMKLVLSKETVRKFAVVTYGKDLAQELGKDVPQVYGGEGKPLEEAEGLKMDE